MATSRKLFSLFGSLVIEGLAKSSKELTAFDKDMRKLNRDLNNLGRDMTKAGKALTKGVTAPVIGLATAITGLSVATGEYADKLLDLQEVTALSTDNLQGLEAVAIEAGVNFEGLAGTIAKFTSKLPEIERGTGLSSDAMKKLGVDVFDANGNVRDMNDLFPEMVNKLQDVENVTERNALSQQLFGRSLGDIAPVLGLTKDRFNELLEGAQDVSGYMSNDALKAANAFRISFEELKRDITGVARGIASDFIPILQNTLVPFIKDSVVPALQGLAGVVKSVIDWFGEHKAIATFAATFVGLMTIAGPIILAFVQFLPLIKGLILGYKVLTGAQLTLNATMAANPIGLITVGIAALIAAGVALWKNWDIVSKMFKEVWGGISFHFKNVASAIAILYSKMIIKILEGVRAVGKFIPGAKKNLDKLITSYKSANFVLQKGIDHRKALRDLQKANNDLMKKEAEVSKASIEVTKAKTEEEKKAAEEKKALTLEELAAAKKLVEDKKKLAEDEAVHAKDIVSRLEEARIGNIEGRLEAARRGTALKIALLEQEKDEEIRIAEETGLSTEGIAEIYAERKISIERDAAAEELKIAEDTAKARISSVKGVLGKIASFVGQISAIWQGSLQKRTEQIDKEREQQIASVEASVMSEESKANAIVAINEEADERKREIQRQNAIREKAAAILGIALSTAVAVAAALPNIPLSIVVGVLGLVQLGIAAAQPIPFEDGGLVRSKPGRGVLAQIGEGKQDEIVIPMETGAQELADNMMSRLGGKASALVGGVSSGVGTTIIKEYHTHQHIGTLIADQFGLKKLSKELRKFNIAENQRAGA